MTIGSVSYKLKIGENNGETSDNPQMTISSVSYRLKIGANNRQTNQVIIIIRAADACEAAQQERRTNQTVKRCIIYRTHLCACRKRRREGKEPRKRTVELQLSRCSWVTAAQQQRLGREQEKNIESGLLK